MRGASLLLVAPSPRARVHDRDARAVPRVDASAGVRRRLGDPARDGAGPGLPRSRAGDGGRPWRSRLGEGTARPVRPSRGRRRLGPGDSRARHGTAPKSRHRHSRGEHRRDPLPRSPRQHRQRPRRQRQRVGNSSTHRARAGIRPARHDRGASEAGSHADLPLLRRRRLRRVRCRAIRRDLAAPRHRARRRVTRCARRLGTAPARDRRARTALAGTCTRAHRRCPSRRISSVVHRRTPAGSHSSSTSGFRSATASRRRFSGREISALRLTTADDGGGDATADTTPQLDRRQFVRLGRAAESILASLDNGIGLAGGTNGYVYLGSRIVRGWAIEFVLLVALIPFLVGVIDLFARSRRRRLPLAGAWRALRTRLGVWLWVGFVIGLGALAGVFPRGSALPPPPDSPAVTDWPVVGLVARRCRRRLRLVASPARSRPASRAPRPDEVLAGYAVSLLALGAVAHRHGRDQPLRVALRRSLAVRVALAAAGRHAARLAARLPVRRSGSSGPALALVAVGTQLELGLEHAAVPRVADDARLRLLADRARPDRVGGGCFAARRSRVRALHARCAKAHGAPAAAEPSLRAAGSERVTRQQGSPARGESRRAR